MIKCRSEMSQKKIEIDLSSESGNAFYILGLVDTLGRQLGMHKKVREDIKKTMMLGSYDDLIKTFDIWFGEFVILYK
tara:strand:+ start:129 stop:359 length:231 start_codon:yes stop_codon:yes gene_type:complete